jgi:pyruvate formate lyase activating enzyme
MITGKIKQIETMGLVDGPGLRVVVFMQGCPLRCLFCHNPEMWSHEGGTDVTPEELVRRILKYKNYFGTEGGVTFSGGEPLSQPAFLKECLKLCKTVNINTCLDTSGVGNGEFYDDILKYTDLVLYDIKALTNDKYREMTGLEIDKSLEFLSLCEKLNKKLWIRCVIVPGINDTDEYVAALSETIKKIKNVERVEFLPYHTMGKIKYENLNIPYRLENTLPMDADRCKELEKKLLCLLDNK